MPSSDAIAGPIGVKVSKLLPSVNCRSGVSSCARRPETSCSAVMPPIACSALSASARYVRRPMTTASSPSKSGRVSSRGMTMSSPWPMTDDGNFAKTTGTAGTSSSDSSACER